MANITLATLRGLWQGVHDWATGANPAFKPIVKIDTAPILKRTSTFNKITGSNDVFVIDEDAEVLTVLTIPVSKDTMISSNSPGFNYGSFAEMYLTGSATSSGRRRAIIGADFSGIIPSTVSEAKLYLYDVNATSPGGNVRTDSGTMNIYTMMPEDADWIEGASNGVTAATNEPSWNNRKSPSSPWVGGGGFGDTPGLGYGDSPIGTFPSTVSYAGPLEISLDLTMFRDYLLHNAGFLIRPATEEPEYSQSIASIQNSDTAKRPYFKITTGIDLSNAEYIAFLASGDGAKVYDDANMTGGYAPINPISGLVLPARTASWVRYAIYVPTGVDVTWFTMGY